MYYGNWNGPSPIEGFTQLIIQYDWHKYFMDLYIYVKPLELVNWLYIHCYYTEKS